MVLAGFDDQHKVAASAVRASAYIAPHLLARAVGTFGVHANGPTTSASPLQHSASARSGTGSSRSEVVESVVSEKAAALLEDLVTDLIAKVRAAVPNFAIEGRPSGAGGSGTTPSPSMSWRSSVSSRSATGGSALPSAARLSAANNSSTTTTTSATSGTANAAITKQSWNACHALGRVLAAVKGSVLHAALTQTARTSNHNNNRSDARGNIGSKNTVGHISSLSNIINSGSSMKAAKKPGSFYYQSEHASFGRLESGGSGGGNGDDVLAARWAQRRKRRALGSGPLPWFDHVFGALTAVLAERCERKERNVPTIWSGPFVDSYDSLFFSTLPFLFILPSFIFYP